MTFNLWNILLAKTNSKIIITFQSQSANNHECVLLNNYSNWYKLNSLLYWIEAMLCYVMLCYSHPCEAINLLLCQFNKTVCEITVWFPIDHLEFYENKVHVIVIAIRNQTQVITNSLFDGCMDRIMRKFNYSKLNNSM